MASLRRKKQGDAGARPERRAARTGGRPAEYDAGGAADRFGPALEEKWAEAWRRARAADIR